MAPRARLAPTINPLRTEVGPVSSPGPTTPVATVYVTADAANAAASAAAAVAAAAAAAASEAAAAADAAAADGDAVAAQASRIAAEAARDITVAARDLTLTYRDAALGYRNDAQTAAGSATADAAAADADRIAAETARTQAETARTQAQTAQTASEGARDLALGYRNDAQTAKTAAETAATAAAASYDSFDDRYLGAKAADPALDNDGNALIVGALYFNTVAGEMRVWTGLAWQAQGLPPDDSITNTKLANMAAGTIKLRPAGGAAGDPVDGTAAQALAITDNRAHGQCFLTFVSATGIRLDPAGGGNKVIINGAQCTVPSAGVAATNAGLAANTRYLAYARDTNADGIVDALELSTTGHSTDTATAGNIGVEIKTGDATRTLVGQVYTNASIQFVDSAQQRFVRSWFNRRSVGLTTAELSVSVTATTATEHTSSRCEALFWADESLQWSVCGIDNSHTDTSYTSYIYGYFDGAALPGGNAIGRTVTNNSIPVCLTGVKTGIAEGYHYFGPALYNNVASKTTGHTLTTAGQIR